MKESKEKQCHQWSQEERGAVYAKMLHNLERTRAAVRNSISKASTISDEECWLTLTEDDFHFSKLCFKKNGSEYKKNIRRPKAHQLMVGTASAIGDQSDASYSSSEDSFCLQMQAKSAKDNTQKNRLQHLVTNTEYTLKPHRRRTKFLRATIDTCSNVNLIPISVYKLVYKDKDCTKLAPSNKVAVKKIYHRENQDCWILQNLLLSTQTQNCYKKWHSKSQAMKAVSLYHVLQVLN